MPRFIDIRERYEATPNMSNHLLLLKRRRERAVVEARACQYFQAALQGFVWNVSESG